MNSSATPKDKGGMKSVGLNEYAKHALREICNQEWVQEKFLKNPEALFTMGENLMDKDFSPKQVSMQGKIKLVN